MLTRLKVNGFKNLVDIDVRFGPFTCIAGGNAVGKSNLFDAISFLSSLADRPFLDAALGVRDEHGRSGDIRSLFHHSGDRFARTIEFEAEMIVSRNRIETRLELKFTFAPLTAENFADFEKLFGPRGACGGCWCMTWRAERAVYEKQKGDGNRDAMRKLAEAGEPTGLLAFQGDEPAGWISVAPRPQFAYLARTRTLQPPDDKPVWSITCFFIAKAFRGQGLARELVKAAEKWAKAKGCETLEGYPIVARSGDLPPVFAWTGLPQTFEKCGFQDCGVPSKSRLLMRKAL